MRVLVLVMLLVGCLEPHQTNCSDGRICPPRLACDDANGGCVLPEQLQTCIGLPDGMDCSIAGAATGVCKNSVCITARCGDGLIKGSERCDGEYLGDNDACDDLGYYSTAALGCTLDCVYDTSACAGSGKCGDAIINGPEVCDGTAVPGDVTCLDFGYDGGFLSCTKACTPDLLTCDHFGFFPVSTNTTGTYRSIWPADDNHVFVAGDGVVARYDGSAWLATPMTDNFNDIYGSSATDVWAVGRNLSIAHFDGSAWTTTYLAGSGSLLSVWARAPNDVYAVGYHVVSTSYVGLVAHWDGAAWSTSDTANTPRSVFGTASDSVFVVGQGGFIEHWNGSSWDDLTTGSASFTAVWATGPTDYYVADATTVSHVQGVTTTSVPLPSGASGIESLWGSSGTLDIAANVGVAIYDGTDTVTLRALGQIVRVRGTSTSLWGITSAGLVRRFVGTGWLAAPRTGYPVSALGGLSAKFVVAGHPTGSGNPTEVWNGSAWTALSGTAVLYATGLAPVTTTLIWASAAPNGNGGALYRWSNGSLGAISGVANGNPWRSIWAASATEAIAVGDGGKAVHIAVTPSIVIDPMLHQGVGDLLSVWGVTDDVYAAGGELGSGALFLHWIGPIGTSTTWSTVTLSGAPDVLRAVWGTSATDVIVVGDKGYVARGSGTTWQVLDVGTKESLYAIGGTGPSDIFVGGANGAVVHWDGTSWSPIRAASGATITGIFATPRQVFFASDGVDILYRPAP